LTPITKKPSNYMKN